MIKKALHIALISILSVVVLFTTSGYTVFQHYCSHSTKVQASIVLEKNCCSELSMGVHFLKHGDDYNVCKSAGCCKTDKVFLKLDNPFEQNSVSRINIAKEIEVNLDVFTTERNADNFIKEINYSYSINAPPLIGKQFIFYTHQLKLSPPVC